MDVVSLQFPRSLQYVGGMCFEKQFHQNSISLPLSGTSVLLMHANTDKGNTFCIAFIRKAKFQVLLLLQSCPYVLLLSEMSIYLQLFIV